MHPYLTDKENKVHYVITCLREWENLYSGGLTLEPQGLDGKLVPYCFLFFLTPYPLRLSNPTHLALALISLIVRITQESTLSCIPNLYIKSTNVEIYCTDPQIPHPIMSSKMLLLYSIMPLFT